MFPNLKEKATGKKVVGVLSGTAIYTCLCFVSNFCDLQGTIRWKTRVERSLELLSGKAVCLLYFHLVQLLGWYLIAFVYNAWGDPACPNNPIDRLQSYMKCHLESSTKEVIQKLQKKLFFLCGSFMFVSGIWEGSGTFLAGALTIGILTLFSSFQSFPDWSPKQEQERPFLLQGPHAVSLFQVLAYLRVDDIPPALLYPIPW